MHPVRFGLCDSCQHQTLVSTTRGSVFSRCDLGLRDPDWPKYPRMPVRTCRRHRPRRESGGPGDG